MTVIKSVLLEAPL